MEQAVWMKVTTDRFRLPLIVADTAAELAFIAGVRTATVIDAVNHGGDLSPYIRVKINKKFTTDLYGLSKTELTI